MNIEDAAHKTVRAYPGGSESLAPRIGMSPAVLRNKVNPNNTTHHLTWVEAAEVMDVTDDDRMLHALAAFRGYTLQRMNAPASGTVLTALLTATSLEGKLAALIVEAIADGRITQNEAKDIGEVCSDAQALIAQVAQHARAAAQSGAPA